MKTQKDENNIKWVFFGTSLLSTIILDELKSKGFLPSLIVTVEDKPKGRKLVMTPPEVKTWAEKNNVNCIQLKTLKNIGAEEEIKKYESNGYDVFIVASYGKIIPQNILDIPRRKTLNVHPSLLPRLRGPSPIKSSILNENETGITIIRLDNELDHGPIIAQKKVIEWDLSNPPYESDLEKLLAKEGGELLLEILPEWIGGKMEEKEQNHSLATFCKKIKKEDAEINLNDIPEKNLRKIRAYHIWPGAYYFHESKRIVIKKAHIENNILILDKIVPEGKKEMNYEDFLRGQK